MDRRVREEVVNCEALWGGLQKRLCALPVPGEVAQT